MNLALVLGCGAAGAVAGAAGYPWAARVAPARSAAEREDPLTPTAAGTALGRSDPGMAEGAAAEVDVHRTAVRPASARLAAPEAEVLAPPEAEVLAPPEAEVEREREAEVLAPPEAELEPDRERNSGPGSEQVLECEAEPELGPRPPAPPSRAAEWVSTSIVSAVLLGAVAARLGAVPVLAAYCVAFAGLVLVSVVDLRVGLVPRKMLYPALVLQGAAMLAAAAAGGHWRALGDAAIGGCGAFVVFFAIWWFYPKGMGFGDVRLSAVTGSVLGWLGLLHAYVGFLVAFVAGAVFGLMMMAVTGGGRKTKMPFAPSLALGAVIGVLWGAPLVNLVFHRSG